MTRNKTMITIFLTMILTLGGAVAASAQTADRTLVTGAYALRQSDFDALAEFYEWLFAAEIAPAERRRLQTLLAAEARAREATAKAIGEVVAGYQKLRAADPEKREAVRREFLPEIVAALENEPSEVNSLLLGIYRRARAETEAAAGPDDAPATDDAPAGDDARGANRSGGVSVADLAGIWSTSSVSTTRYRSLVTGELSDPSGSIIEYQISPDGAIRHVGYLSSTVYSCTTKLFISRTGRVSLSGATITFDFAPGKRLYQTCSAAASRNDTLPAERKTYPFRLDRDGDTLRLCTIENGKDFCLRKKR